jgi:DNA topoisomerase III
LLKQLLCALASRLLALEALEALFADLLPQCRVALLQGVINEIAAEAGKLIAVLSQYTGALVNLNRPASIATRRARGKAYSKRKVDNASTRTSGSAELKRKLRRPRKTKINTLNEEAPTRGPSASCSPPTTRMVAFAEKLAKDKKVDLPAGYARDFEVCRRFLDDHAGR